MSFSPGQAAELLSKLFNHWNCYLSPLVLHSLYWKQAYNLIIKPNVVIMRKDQPLISKNKYAMPSVTEVISMHTGLNADDRMQSIFVEYTYTISYWDVTFK
jgi:hypothetical protein